MHALMAALLLAASAQDSNIVEHLGTSLPLASVWRDTFSKPVRLGDVVTGENPTVLVLHYFACPMLCSMVLDGLGNALDALPLQAGHDYNVLSISFDANDTVAAARTRQEATLAKHHHRIDSWPFLTGDQEAIGGLLDALGMHVWRDPVSGDYAHPAAIFIIAPDGTIAQYLYGVRFAPEDVRQGLRRAREGLQTSTLQRIFLRCFAYHPAARRFAPLLVHVMRVAGLVSLAVLGAGFLWLQGRRRKTA